MELEEKTRPKGLMMPVFHKDSSNEGINGGKMHVGGEAEPQGALAATTRLRTAVANQQRRGRC